MSISRVASEPALNKLLSAFRSDVALASSHLWISSRITICILVPTSQSPAAHDNYLEPSAGFEPATTDVRSVVLCPLSYEGVNGGSRRTRTPNRFNTSTPLAAVLLIQPDGLRVGILSYPVSQSTSHSKHIKQGDDITMTPNLGAAGRNRTHHRRLRAPCITTLLRRHW